MQGSQRLSPMLGTCQPPSPVSAFPKPCQQGWKGKQPVVAVPALGPPDPPSVLSRGPGHTQVWPPRDDPPGMRWKERGYRLKSCIDLKST